MPYKIQHVEQIFGHIRIEDHRELTRLKALRITS